MDWVIFLGGAGVLVFLACTAWGILGLGKDNDR